MSKVIYITTYCPDCNRETNIPVTEEGYNKRLNGAKVQDAFPELTPAQREMLITGICGDCWNAMFKEDDDDS